MTVHSSIAPSAVSAPGASTLKASTPGASTPGASTRGDVLPGRVGDRAGQTAAAAGLRVAVTGAGGFIGGRLATLLDAAPGMVPVVRLARRRLDGKPVPLDDEAKLRAVLAGCHALVHCAFDAYDDDANVRAATTIGRFCAGSGIRLVHLSTAAVYEPLPDGMLAETSPVPQPATGYQAVKLAVERTLLDLVASSGLDLVVLQPTIVYGPHGGAWTDGPVRELLTGDVVLPDAGEGLCNAVFVDDLCAAAIAACTAPLAAGERLLISGAGPVPWRRFFTAYADMLGLDAVRLAPAERSSPAGPDVSSAAPGSAGGLQQRVRRLVLGRLGARRRARLMLLVRRIRTRLRGRGTWHADGAKRALYEARCTVSIDKAERLLGYRPQFDFAAGMAATTRYVRTRYR